MHAKTTQHVPPSATLAVDEPIARPGEGGPRQSSNRETTQATGGRIVVYPPEGDPDRGSPRRRELRVRGMFIERKLDGRPRPAGRPPRLRSTPASAGASAAASGGATDMDALIAAAKAEGGLTTIALPRDWCNYGDAHRRLHRQVRHPDQRAQPGRRLEGRDRGDQGQQGQPRARSAGRRRRRPGLRPAGRDQGLFQPYKVATWDTIPDSAKDRRRQWYGDYYGVMSFEVNTKVVTERPEGLGRPAEARVQEPGRPRRRPARVEPGQVGRVGRRPVAERRQPRQRQAGPRLLQAAQRCRQLRPGHRKHRDRRLRRHADPHRAGPTTAWPTRTR